MPERAITIYIPAVHQHRPGESVPGLGDYSQGYVHFDHPDSDAMGNAVEKFAEHVRAKVCPSCSHFKGNLNCIGAFAEGSRLDHLEAKTLRMTKEDFQRSDLPCKQMGATVKP